MDIPLLESSPSVFIYFESGGNRTPLREIMGTSARCFSEANIEIGSIGDVVISSGNFLKRFPVQVINSGAEAIFFSPIL